MISKLNLLSTFVVAGLLILAGNAFAAPTPVSVSTLDLNRYMGDWYQISHVPLTAEFDKKMCACARQRLVLGQSEVSVRNTCNAETASGALVDVRGNANYTDVNVSPSQFTVNLEVAPNVWAQASYWVIGIDSEYRFAVVSNSTGTALYILSRTPEMDQNLYNQALKIAINQNLDLRNLKPTLQLGCSYP